MKMKKLIGNRFVIMNKEDPFIIIKDHRIKQAQQRACLRLLDINTLETRVPTSIKRTYSYEDKENCNLFGEDVSEQILRKIPKPHHNELINYSDYDLHFE